MFRPRPFSKKENLEFIIQKYQEIIDNSSNVKTIRWALKERDKYKRMLSSSF